MKSLINIALLFGLISLNSCAITKRPQLLQSNLLTSKQELQQSVGFVSIKEKPVFCLPQLNGTSHADSIKNQTISGGSKKKVLLQNFAFKKFNTEIITIPVTRLKTIGNTFLRPSAYEAYYSRNSNIESNIYSKLATLFLILTLCMIVVFFVAANSELPLAFSGGIVLLILVFLLACLVFFIIGLVHRKK